MGQNHPQLKRFCKTNSALSLTFVEDMFTLELVF